MNKQIFNSLGTAILTLSVSVFSSVSQPVYAAPSATVDEYSVLPETFGNRPDLTPNILIILDNSGSMGATADEDGSNFVNDNGLAHDPRSNSYRVRTAFQNVLTNNQGKFNVGLMAYGANNNVSGTVDVTNCNGYPGCDADGDGRITYYQKSYGDKRGILVSPMKPLDTDHLAEMTTLMAIEPETPSVVGNSRSNGGDNYSFRFGTRFSPGLSTYFSEQDDVLDNGIIRSVGSTPLPGTLYSAYQYLVNNDLRVSTNGGINEIHKSLWTNPAATSSPTVDPGVYPNLTISPPGSDLNGDGVVDADDVLLESCQPNTYVFLLTDGRSNRDFVRNSGDGGPNATTSSPAIAAELLAAGVETWVFGFALPDTNSFNRIEAIADAGGRAVPAGEDSGFYSSNSADLQAQLEAALADIETQLGSASGLSVVTSSTRSTGSVVQALYVPEVQEIDDQNTAATDDDTITDIVYWAGSMAMYFVDERGNLREDNGTTPGILDGSDEIFELDFNPTTKVVDVIRSPGTLGETIVSLEDLVPIWDAADVLNGYDQDGTNGGVSSFVLQRDYDDIASEANGYRHIFTTIDGDKLDFSFTDNTTATTINSTNFTMLALDSAGDDVDLDGDDWDIDDIAAAKLKAENLIAFTRGLEGPVGGVTGYRDRTITAHDDVTDNTPYILGDILHSTAAQIDVPNDNTNLLFSAIASSYANFKDEYEERGRRRVIYVGGNDGMLHAFNGGFWDPNDVAFRTNNPDNPGDVEHELGAELWAYVPESLLPHLKWVASPTYNASQHVAYMDGPVQTFDVQIFEGENPSDYPDGWGTILVAGMHLGGGTFDEIDHDANASTAPITTRSTYVVLDITNPENEPRVLAELTDDNLGFTTSLPTVVREFDGTDVDWFLVFGSGPTEIQTSTSTQQASIYKYNLETEAITETQLPAANSFVGDIVSVDWDNDYDDEVVYFGTVEGTIDAPDGKMNRLYNGTVNTVFNTNQPVPYRAVPVTDRANNNWLFFGTGRLFDTDDFTQTDQNTFYGIKEPVDADNDLTFNPVASGSVIDVSNVQVSAVDGDLSPGISAGGNSLTTFDDLKAYMLSEGGGWKADFDAPIGSPFSLRNTAEALVFRNFLFYTSFSPPASDGNACTNEFGTSFLSAVDFTTGTPPFIEDFDGLLDNDGSFFNDRVEIGDGIASTASLLIVPLGPNDETGLRIKIPLSTGEIGDVEIPLPPILSGRKSWTEIEFQQ